MSRKKLIYLTIGLVGVAILSFGFSRLENGAVHASVPGPDISVKGQTWATQIVQGKEGHDQFAVWAVFKASKIPDREAASFDYLMLIDMCNAVIDNLGAVAPKGVDVSDIDHVDLNVEIGRQTAYPHDISVFLENGECIDRFSVNDLVEREDTASKHDFGDEINAAILNWGLENSGVKFVRKNKERFIEVEIQRLSNFDRDVESMNALALCVKTLATMREYPSLIVTKLDPKSYNEMRIKIVHRRGTSFAHFTTGYGTATVGLDNGKCKEAVS